MACDFLLMAMALLLESSPVRLQFQHQHRDQRNNHSRRAAHNGRHFQGCRKINSDEEDPRRCKSSSGQLGTHEPK